jgi:hypothetical protein
VTQPRRNARIGGAIALSLATTGVVVACASSPDPTEVTNIYTSPNAYVDFAGGGANAGVQGMLANKCGTLDCHGSIGRSLRIFSQNGLRLVDDAGDVPGGGATTPAEVFANYTAAISVQPELTSKVFYGLEDPHVLLLLRKPLGLERHKGGVVLVSGDPGDLCLSTWLQDGLVNTNNQPITLDNTACNKEAQLP